MMKTKTDKKIRPGAVAAATALMVMTASVPAFADFITGTVGLVEFSTGTLIVQSASVNYYAQLTTQPGCESNNQTADTLKAWQSLSQAALLSGKTVQIYYNVCNGTNYISALDLKQ